MSERENIFARIREALAIPAHGPVGGLPTVTEQRRVMPAVDDTFNGQLTLFRQNATDLRADFQIVRDVEELKTKLAALGTAEGWKKVAVHDGQLSGAAARALGLPILLTDGGYNARELETCNVGITECDALVAQTGSVLITNRSAGGRALSILPPHHVVIARRGQLVGDLPAAFEVLRQKYDKNLPSMISFVTGPSRTGDIERILVLGAHGPKQLTIFCLSD